MSSQLLQELRRGAKHAEITQIIFHRSSMYLACASNKEAVHIFELYDSVKSLEKTEQDEFFKDLPPDEIGYSNEKITLDSDAKNKTAKLALIGSIFTNYFKSHWSLAKMKLDDAGKFCCFSEGNFFTSIFQY